MSETTNTTVTRAPEPLSPLREFWHYFRRNKGALIGLIYILLMLLIAVFAPLLAPHLPDEQFRDHLLQPPVWQEGGSWQFSLGTDDIGRDILSRLMYGARLSLLVGCLVVALSLLLGVVIGLAAGYFGGWVDALIMRIVDIMLALPSLLLALVLVAIFATLSQTLDAPQLGMWAITAFATKVVLVPLIMGYAFRKLSDPTANGGVISPAWLMLAAAVIVVLCWFVVEPVKLPMVADLKPALAVSLGHFMLGLLCIVTQRNILKQAFGYCLMENGSHLTLALLAYKAPELVEIGIATDAIFAVIIMAVLARKIYRTLNTLNVDQLTALKG